MDFIIIIIIKKVGLQSTTSHCLKGRRNFSPSYKNSSETHCRLTDPKRFQAQTHLWFIKDPQEETSIPYKLAKWLNDKLKPLSTIGQTISDILFADDLHEMKIADQDILMSYNISSFFTKISVDETIKIYRKYVLNITKTDLNDLLEVATKKQRTTNSKCVYVPY